MKVDLVTGEPRKGTPTSASLVVLSWANGGRGSLAVCQRRKPNMSRALCVVFVCRLSLSFSLLSLLLLGRLLSLVQSIKVFNANG